jgi:hypothetical protein
MGNQESVPNTNNVKKKVKNTQQQQQPKINQIRNNKPNYNKQQYQENQQYQQQYQQQYHQKQFNHNNYYIPQHQYVDKNVYYENYDPQQKLVNRNNNNNAIMERNVFNDIYNRNNQNNLFDYPTNSNNELSIPKPNFDNLEFTPYNFNENVNKFKKSIADEREKFENNELERRKQFDSIENKKKEFLNNEIKKFESNYNPWELLGLDYNDYNINNIKKAYKKCALKYHPDRAGKKYEDKFQLITQSYIYLLTKAEEQNSNEIKINRVVENIDYEDNINENVENIYISKDKFDINQFNKIFDKYKIPDTFDQGYADLMKEDIKNNDENHVFGKNFNNDIFNAHFDNIKNKKKSSSIIEYQEPNALESSVGNSNVSFLGVNVIEDFGSMNNNNLSYTDYKKAHVDETLLINPNKVKYKSYKSIDDLESDRSRLSYNPTPEDRRNYEIMQRKREEEDNLRIQQQRNYDMMVEKQYNKLNRKLIVHK